jgi:alpha-tubulin suppressor-like RCC1 family protein
MASGCQRSLDGKHCPCTRRQYCCADGICRDQCSHSATPEASGGKTSAALPFGGGDGDGDGDGGTLDDSAGAVGGEIFEEPAAPPIRALSASTDLEDRVHLSFSAEASSAPSHYVVERGGRLIATLHAATDNGEASYEDYDADPGRLSAPALHVSSDDVPPGVLRLRFTTPLSVAGRELMYSVSAVYGDRASPPVSVWGRRAAPELTGYEFSRDDGVTWFDAGSSNSFDDDAAEPGQIRAVASAEFEPNRHAVLVALSEAPAIVAAAPSPYRVRAVSAVSKGEASEAVPAAAAVGRLLAYEWQRSASESDAGYVTLPGVTGSIAFDEKPALDSARYYRVLVTAAGAVGTSAPVRARASSTENVSVTLSGYPGHGCAVDRDGQVRCWGDDSSRPATLDGEFEAVSVGGNHSCALRAGGHVSCWGDIDEAAIPEQVFVAISSGDEQTCGLQMDGTLVCWGDTSLNPELARPTSDSYRALSVGPLVCAVTMDDQLVCFRDGTHGTPTAAEQGSFQAVSVGRDTTCGLGVDGSVSCWRNDTGEPSLQLPSGVFQSVSAGDGQVCGVLDSGKLICWGKLNIDVDAIPDIPFRSVTSGSAETCALAREGQVYCWSSNVHYDSVHVWSGDGFQSLSAGDYSACGIRNDQSLLCWGLNVHGEAPRNPLPDALVRAVSVGGGHACALLAEDGQVRCWGDSTQGQLDDIPREPLASLSAGGLHTCGLLADGAVTCWGSNNFGQLEAERQESFAALAAGALHTCALTTSGFVRCWGNDMAKQVSGAPPDGGFVSLDSDGATTCAATEQGKVVCWGDLTSLGPATPPPGFFSSLAVGSSHVCAITGDSSVVCWGDPSKPQASAPPGFLDSFEALAAGPNFTCGLRSDHKAVCWGTTMSSFP